MTEYLRKSFSVGLRGRPKCAVCNWVRIYRNRVECVQCGHTETMEEYKARTAPKEPTP